MALVLRPEKCIACCACELACSIVRDDAFTTLSSSVVLYRGEEKRNYFGLMVKKEAELMLGRPEKVEVTRIGQSQSDSKVDGAAAKPILLRQACDLCPSRGEYNCVRFCPTGALEHGE